MSTRVPWFRSLWVVEMFERGRWQSTVEVGITRTMGREGLQRFKRENPRHRARLVIYTPRARSLARG